MSDDDKNTIEQAADVAENPMSLEDRLNRCKSRKSARETIADFCRNHELDPKEYELSTEALTILSSLR